jgi:PPM family protein phosphatase
MSLLLRAVIRTDLGLRRETNEDEAFAGTRLIAVADGVGGLPAGELASAAAIAVVSSLDGRAEPEGDPLTVLRETVEAASARIAELVAEDPALTGMGTTLTAMWLVADRIAMVHIGDSRGYLRRGGELSQITRDDSYVQMLLDSGAITPEQARVHPQRSLVSQVLQARPAQPTYTLLRPDPGDRVLLCSDGLSDVVTDEQIGQVLRDHPEPDECAAELVKLALAAGGPDNVTVVLADVVEAPEGQH